ncbi:Bifunctional xylanase/deacetylase Includes: RecName: Full=Endo-1,4-beta-xylanase D [Rhizoctonia solani AG-1 IB]|uniref:XynD protein n=1 Tax=Thanatephorus cucumeris (strain AG1-IB / isolate 7/3/14) TaxID=1108050 RepID=M5BK42_THACB|nr:Bifunctional xylanase/deacetylase Includes: RecName: Full=Endo-1,4-beta-xylanase D [Rhizoctonia solani AG-1 IB]
MRGTFGILALSIALGSVTQARPFKRQAQVITSCTVPNTAAITFDDGPYTWTRQIVDTLDAAGAKGTFFVNGNNFGCIYSGSNPSNLKYAYDQGHQIASHTWSHPHLAGLSSSQTKDEFTKINKAIQEIIGAVPAFIRPPYGEYSPITQGVAGELGQTIVTWDFDSGDTAELSATQSIEAYREWIIQRPNSILTLNHETHSSTANVLLPEVIAALKGAGYRLVTVAECVGMNPYLPTDQSTGPTGSC